MDQVSGIEVEIDNIIHRVPYDKVRFLDDEGTPVNVKDLLNILFKSGNAIAALDKRLSHVEHRVGNAGVDIEKIKKRVTKTEKRFK